MDKSSKCMPMDSQFLPVKFMISSLFSSLTCELVSNLSFEGQSHALWGFLKEEMQLCLPQLLLDVCFFVFFHGVKINLSHEKELVIYKGNKTYTLIMHLKFSLIINMHHFK